MLHKPAPSALGPPTTTAPCKAPTIPKISGLTGEIRHDKARHGKSNEAYQQPIPMDGPPFDTCRSRLPVDGVPEVELS